MAASAEQNEIIELTDLIEKGPALPKNSPKTPEPLPLPDEVPATAAPATIVRRCMIPTVFCSGTMRNTGSGAL